MSEYKNQHYVPKFYLKRFLNSEGRIWVYDKHKSRSFAVTNLANIGSENYFYELQDSNLSDDSKILERIFSEIEGKTEPILTILINSLENNNFKELDRNTRDVLCWHIVHQIIRGPEHREVIRQMINLLKNEVGLNDSSTQKDHHITSLLFGDKTEIYNTLNNHLWIIYKNETETPFYTSDTPVMKKGHLSDPYISMEGLASPGIEIFLPISPKFIIILAESGSFKSLQRYNNQMLILEKEEYIQYYNAIQVTNSYRFVYSNLNDFKHAQAIIADLPISADPNRKRVE